MKLEVQSISAQVHWNGTIANHLLFDFFQIREGIVGGWLYFGRRWNGGDGRHCCPETAALGLKAAALDHSRTKFALGKVPLKNHHPVTPCFTHKAH